jgi:uncharacterized membrane protein HdeD (DUF308 family)
MDKSLILKIAGAAGIVGGCVCLFLSGVGADNVTAIVGAVFTLCGVIAILFGSKK